MLMLALLAAAQAAATPSEVKTFGDWAVACDNLRFCEAASLSASDEIENPPQIAITREAGPGGALEIEVTPDAEYRGSYRLEIDGKSVSSGTLGGPSVIVRDAAALQLAEAMLKGQAMTMRAGDGKPLSQASLKGISATLRYFDAEQGRAGTVTALVAKGPRPAVSVPAAPPAPRIAAIRPSGTAASVSKAMRAAMEKASDCDGLYEGTGVPAPDVETYALGGGKTLALIPCGAGAYNYSTVPFILSGGRFALAKFDMRPGMSPDGPPMLVNVDWDPKLGLLASFAKGRGIGDCGSSEQYVWDGTMFRLVEARAMGECRGSINWLRVWRAEADSR
ncbi:MAG: DUF1176 domain-containing protein [Sphingomonas sp.]|uniref:DUF1176 domain-containing protein n=1 Tax=Sphingomonas sp. TaxID=28214 RepID=UPI001B2861F8|nr:DUF1176 domain-containing protein [Sphingomonas sp.]MBO9621864.1 DUF1176 domain-containing protein [Sphingomonas sp.]